MEPSQLLWKALEQMEVRPRHGVAQPSCLSVRAETRSGAAEAVAFRPQILVRSQSQPPGPVASNGPLLGDLHWDWSSRSFESSPLGLLEAQPGPGFSLESGNGLL